MENNFITLNNLPARSVVIRQNMEHLMNTIKQGKTPQDSIENAWKMNLKKAKDLFYVFQVIDQRIVDIYTLEDAEFNDDRNRVNLKLSNSTPERIKKEYRGKYIYLENQNPIRYTDNK